MPSSRASRRRCERAAAERLHDPPADVEVRSLVEQLPAILYVSDVGVEGALHYVSPGVRSILGFEPEEWIADPGLWARQIHPEDRDRVFGREDELAEPSVPEEYRMCHRDGTTVWVRDEAALVTDAHGPRVLARRDLRHHRPQARRGGAGAPRRTAGRGGAARQARPAGRRRRAADARGARPGDPYQRVERGRGARARRGDGHARARRIAVAAEAAGERDVPRDCTAIGARGAPSAENPALGVRGRAAERRDRPGRGPRRRWGVLWLGDACETRDGRRRTSDFVQALANILADAIQQSAIEDDIRYQAIHDPLTGLPNRVLFLDRLANALARPGAEVAVVLLDIDNFKLVNDSLGHGAGDELLMQIAPRLQNGAAPGRHDRAPRGRRVRGAARADPRRALRGARRRADRLGVRDSLRTERGRALRQGEPGDRDRGARAGSPPAR